RPHIGITTCMFYNLLRFLCSITRLSLFEKCGKQRKIERSQLDIYLINVGKENQDARYPERLRNRVKGGHITVKTNGIAANPVGMDGFLLPIPSEKGDGYADGRVLRHTSFPIPFPREKPLLDLKQSFVDAIALAFGEQFRTHCNGLMLLDGS
ncbi:MAG: hypothetical protein IJQ98_11945, partial [Oscillospiraceae bacterium]|nr:hypothetical protein [Oscillospiraceae bacterium]